MNILKDPPPPRRNKENRLTEEMKNLQPGESVIVCPKTARCIAAYFRYHGRLAQTSKVSETEIQVWVL